MDEYRRDVLFAAVLAGTAVGAVLVALAIVIRPLVKMVMR